MNLKGGGFDSFDPCPYRLLSESVEAARPSKGPLSLALSTTNLERPGRRGYLSISAPPSLRTPRSFFFLMDRWPPLLLEQRDPLCILFGFSTLSLPFTTPFPARRASYLSSPPPPLTRPPWLLHLSPATVAPLNPQRGGCRVPPPLASSLGLSAECPDGHRGGGVLRNQDGGGDGGRLPRKVVAE